MLSVWWRVAYWYGFAAQFTALPFHQEFADSGHFTFLDRCRTSLRNNLIFYAILAVCIPSHLTAVICTIACRFAGRRLQANMTESVSASRTRSPCSKGGGGYGVLVVALCGLCHGFICAPCSGLQIQNCHHAC